MALSSSMIRMRLAICRPCPGALMRFDARPIGSVTSTSVPDPTVLRTSIRPPWLSTMRFAIGRPRPLPLTVTLPPR